MIRRLYDWTMGLAKHRRANWALAGVSFTESSFFPIPPDVLLIPMVLQQRHRAWWIAGICTVASVLGGLFGYAIGYLLYEWVGLWVLNLYGYVAKAEEFREMFRSNWGAWFLFIGGLTPVPFKITTIACGMAEFNILQFIAIAGVTRGARFYLVTAVLYYFGEPVRQFIERRLELVFTSAAVLMIGGFLVVRYAI